MTGGSGCIIEYFENNLNLQITYFFVLLLVLHRVIEYLERLYGLSYLEQMSEGTFLGGARDVLLIAMNVDEMEDYFFPKGTFLHIVFLMG